MRRRSNAGKWDAETTARFVNLYKKHECLWNPLSDEYKFKRARDIAVEEIRKKMKIDGLEHREVKEKIRSLRSTYLQEKRKIDAKVETSRRSGYTSNLIWYNAMDDIMQKIQNKEPVSETSKPALQENNSSSDNDEAEYTELETLETERLSDSILSSNSNHEDERCVKIEFTQLENSLDDMKPPRRRKPKRFRQKREDRTSVNRERNVSGAEFDIFGDSVAAQLKKLSETQALIAQHQIQSILSRCRIHDIRDKYDHKTPQSITKNKRKHCGNNEESVMLVKDGNGKRKRKSNRVENEIDGKTCLLDDPLISCDCCDTKQDEIHNWRSKENKEDIKKVITQRTCSDSKGDMLPRGQIHNWTSGECKEDTKHEQIENWSSNEDTKQDELQMTSREDMIRQGQIHNWTYPKIK